MYEPQMGLARSYADFRFHFCIFWRRYDLVQLWQIRIVQFFFPWGILPLYMSRLTGACPETNLIMRVNVRKQHQPL